LDEDWDIIMEVTSWDIYHLIVPKDNSSKNIITYWPKPKIEKAKTTFTYTRYFEDTDFFNIVWKNDNWVFIIDKNKENIGEDEQEKLIYYKDLVKYIPNYKLFIMLDFNDEIIILDEKWSYFISTDLEKSNEIENISKSDNDKILEIKVKWENVSRKYVI
jgi:hypothetical protein